MTSNNDKNDWNRTILYIFDAPNAIGDLKERMNYAKLMIPSHPQIKFVNHWKVHDIEDILMWSSIENGDVEGLMLHSSNHRYMIGRHPSILKLKVFSFFFLQIFPFFESILLIWKYLDSKNRMWKSDWISFSQKSSSCIAVRTIFFKNDFIFFVDFNFKKFYRKSNTNVWVHSRQNYQRMISNFPIGTNVNVFYYEKHESGVPRNAALCKLQSQYGISFLFFSFKEIDC